MLRWLGRSQQWRLQPSSIRLFNTSTLRLFSTGAQKKQHVQQQQQKQKQQLQKQKPQKQQQQQQQKQKQKQKQKKQLKKPVRRNLKNKLNVLLKLKWYQRMLAETPTPPPVPWSKDGQMLVKHPALTEYVKTLSKTKQKMGLNLWEILSNLPKNGQGFRVTRRIYLRYPEPSYYTIHHVKPPRHGHDFVIYGELTWRGKPEGRVRKLKRYAKRGWRLLDLKPIPKFKPRLPLRSVMSQKKIAKRMAKDRVQEVKKAPPMSRKRFRQEKELKKMREELAAKGKNQRKDKESSQ